MGCNFIKKLNAGQTIGVYSVSASYYYRNAASLPRSRPLHHSTIYVAAGVIIMSTITATNLHGDTIRKTGGSLGVDIRVKNTSVYSQMVVRVLHRI